MATTDYAQTTSTVLMVPAVEEQKMSIIKTDPDVKQFIINILKDE